MAPGRLRRCNIWGWALIGEDWQCRTNESSVCSTWVGNSPARGNLGTTRVWRVTVITCLSHQWWGRGRKFVSRSSAGHLHWRFPSWEYSGVRRSPRSRSGAGRRPPVPSQPLHPPPAGAGAGAGSTDTSPRTRSPTFTPGSSSCPSPGTWASWSL